MKPPHFVSEQEFQERIITWAKSLTPAEKAEARAALYKWSDERLAKLKPASDRVQ